MDNQHKKITGYRDFDRETIDLINKIKECESDVGNLWRMIRDGDSSEAVDYRWINIARTNFETGFMALVRSVAMPMSPFDSMDDDGDDNS